MFVEERIQGKIKKYYLVHSYRVGDRVNRIARYLGSDLSGKELERLRKRAEELILSQAADRSIFEFELSSKEIADLRKLERPIKIEHLNNLDWQGFAENFAYNTNAIEGSTVNLGEAADLIKQRNLPKNKDELETVGVADAVRCIKTAKSRLDAAFIRKLHFLCFKGTKEFAGRLRTVEVVIKDKSGNITHQGAPSGDVKKLLASLCSWYEKHKNKYPPLLLASLVHNEFENIHPFQDGNGRVGRLLLNYVLIRHGYPPISICVEDRQRYYRVLQVFEKKNEIAPTMKFLISQYKKQYR